MTFIGNRMKQRPKIKKIPQILSKSTSQNSTFYMVLQQTAQYILSSAEMICKKSNAQQITEKQNYFKQMDGEV